MERIQNNNNNNLEGIITNFYFTSSNSIFKRGNNKSVSVATDGNIITLPDTIPIPNIFHYDEIIAYVKTNIQSLITEKLTLIKPKKKYIKKDINTDKNYKKRKYQNINDSNEANNNTHIGNYDMMMQELEEDLSDNWISENSDQESTDDKDEEEEEEKEEEHDTDTEIEIVTSKHNNKKKSKNQSIIIEGSNKITNSYTITPLFKKSIKNKNKRDIEHEPTCKSACCIFIYKNNKTEEKGCIDSIQLYNHIKKHNKGREDILFVTYILEPPSCINNDTIILSTKVSSTSNISSIVNKIKQRILYYNDIDTNVNKKSIKSIEQRKFDVYRTIIYLWREYIKLLTKGSKLGLLRRSEPIFMNAIRANILPYFDVNSVEYVGLSLPVARSSKFTHLVTDFNKDFCQRMVNAFWVNSITRNGKIISLPKLEVGFVIIINNKKYVLHRNNKMNIYKLLFSTIYTNDIVHIYQSEKKYIARDRFIHKDVVIGDILTRYMIHDDLVTLFRNPVMEASSVFTRKAYIVDINIHRFLIYICQCWLKVTNADFDGDNMVVGVIPLTVDSKEYLQYKNSMYTRMYSGIQYSSLYSLESSHYLTLYVLSKMSEVNSYIVKILCTACKFYVNDHAFLVSGLDLIAACFPPDYIYIDNENQVFIEKNKLWCKELTKSVIDPLLIFICNGSLGNVSFQHTSVILSNLYNLVTYYGMYVSYEPFKFDVDYITKQKLKYRNIVMSKYNPKIELDQFAQEAYDAYITMEKEIHNHICSDERNKNCLEYKIALAANNCHNGVDFDTTNAIEKLPPFDSWLIYIKAQPNYSACLLLNNLFSEYPITSYSMAPYLLHLGQPGKEDELSRIGSIQHKLSLERPLFTDKIYGLLEGDDNCYISHGDRLHNGLSFSTPTVSLSMAECKLDIFNTGIKEWDEIKITIDYSRVYFQFTQNAPFDLATLYEMGLKRHATDYNIIANDVIIKYAILTLKKWKLAYNKYNIPYSEYLAYYYCYHIHNGIFNNDQNHSNYVTLCCIYAWHKTLCFGSTQMESYYRRIHPVDILYYNNINPFATFIYHKDNCLDIYNSIISKLYQEKLDSHKKLSSMESNSFIETQLKKNVIHYGIYQLNPDNNIITIEELFDIAFENDKKKHVTLLDLIKTNTISIHINESKGKNTTHPYKYKIYIAVDIDALRGNYNLKYMNNIIYIAIYNYLAYLITDTNNYCAFLESSIDKLIAMIYFKHSNSKYRLLNFKNLMEYECVSNEWMKIENRDKYSEYYSIEIDSKVKSNSFILKTPIIGKWFSFERPTILPNNMILQYLNTPKDSYFYKLESENIVFLDIYNKHTILHTNLKSINKYYGPFIASEISALLTRIEYKSPVLADMITCYISPFSKLTNTLKEKKLNTVVHSASNVESLVRLAKKQITLQDLNGFKPNDTNNYKFTNNIYDVQNKSVTPVFNNISTIYKTPNEVLIAVKESYIKYHIL